MALVTPLTLANTAWIPQKQPPAKTTVSRVASRAGIALRRTCAPAGELMATPMAPTTVSAAARRLDPCCNIVCSEVDASRLVRSFGVGEFPPGWVGERSGLRCGAHLNRLVGVCECLGIWRSPDQV